MWALTPLQFNLVAEGHAERGRMELEADCTRAWLAEHAARQKALPSLSKWLAKIMGKKEQPKNLSAQIIEWARGHNAAERKKAHD